MEFYEEYLPLLELNNSKYSVIALTGGRGSEKTGHVLRGVLKCSLEQKKKTCFFRETKETLSDSLKAELDGIIDEEFQGRGFTYTKEEVRHLNGSYMFFKGLKEVNLKAIENLKGIATTTDFFIVDEAQAVSKAVWDVLIPTLRKEGCVLIVIYNRITDDLPVEEVLFLDYETMTAPDNTYFIEVNYPELMHLGHLSKEFLDRAELLKKNKPQEYETFYLNKPQRDNENYVVKEFTNFNLMDFHYCDDLDIYLTCDFNVDPMCWALFHKDDKNFYFFDEIIEENTITKKCIEYFHSKYKNHKANIYLMGDASGDRRSTTSEHSNFATMENFLNKNGFKGRVDRNLRYTNPLIKNRISAFNNMICDLNNERHIFINPKTCPKIANTLKNIKYREGTRDIEKCTPSLLTKFREKGIKYWEHLFDAISYPAEYFNPVVME